MPKNNKIFIIGIICTIILLQIIVIFTYYFYSTPKIDLYNFTQGNLVGGTRESKQLKDIYKKVYTIDNIFTKTECKQIIDECELYANNKKEWTLYQRDNYYTLDNLINNIDSISNLVEHTIYTKIIPEYATKYNIPSNLLKLDKNELFIIKYYNGNTVNIETNGVINNKNKNNNKNNNKIVGYHQDKSPFSFNIALNDEFDGGGTHFSEINHHVNNPVGSCLIFCGKNTHSGIKINTGTRYVIYGSFAKHDY